ncbi:hypothetical protein [Paraburkholderia sp. C35]|uniref:hypothetical protein n=1 Tax=Paraburkholderia sp. C35 TaxID=2126993 RepID=UPI000D691C00|nr:hypothetical protein [Paraburkholderia sp. C35]
MKKNVLAAIVGPESAWNYARAIIGGGCGIGTLLELLDPVEQARTGLGFHGVALAMLCLGLAFIVTDLLLCAICNRAQFGFCVRCYLAVAALGVCCLASDKAAGIAFPGLLAWIALLASWFWCADRVREAEVRAEALAPIRDPFSERVLPKVD